MSRFLKNEWLQLIILAVPFVLIAIFWNQIPDRVPIHWNYEGHADNFGSKAVGLFIVPLVNIGVAALLGGLGRIDPKYLNMNVPGVVLRPIRLIVTIFLSALFIVTTLPMAGIPINIGDSMQLGLPVLLFFIGNYLQTIKPNYFIGVRTPWTLEDPENWRRTHQFAGRIWMAVSVVYIIAVLLLRFDVPKWMFWSYLGIIGVLPIAFSFIIFQKGKSTKLDTRSLAIILVLILFMPRSSSAQVNMALAPWLTSNLIQSGQSNLRASTDTSLSARLQAALESTYQLTPLYDRHGVAASVIVPGYPQWSGAAGTKDGHNPMSASLSFEIGSSTKSFVSALIFALRDEGKLSLKDSIRKYLPHYPNVDSTITIQQLLNHSSGLYDYLNDDPSTTLLNDAYATDPSHHWTPGEILSDFVGTENFKPSKGYRYSNTDYLLLCEIADSIEHLPVSEQIHTRFLAPLGLTHTLCSWDDTIPTNFPHDYSNATAQIAATDWFGVDKTAQLSETNAAGGMVSVPEELARWSQALYTGKVLSKTSTAALLNLSNFHQLTNGLLYGLGDVFLGYSYDNQPIFGHPGSMLGFVTFMLTVPHDSISMVVYLNSLTDTIICANYVNALLWEIYHPAANNVVEANQAVVSSICYPNPFGDHLTISQGSEQEGEFILYDALGREVKSAPVSASKPSFEMDTHDLRAGIYYYVLRRGANYERGQLVKN